MIKTKNLAEVDVTESVDGINFICEQDGKIRKVNGDKFKQVEQIEKNSSDISELKGDLDDETARATNRENEIESLFTMPTQEAVNKWLNEHPEATTTVQDHSLTMDKLVIGTLSYVTPQMFGAKGDGVTICNESFTMAVNSGYPVFVPDGDYLFTIPYGNDRGGAIRVVNRKFVKIDLSPKARLIFDEPTFSSTEHFQGTLFCFDTCKDVRISGGEIIGDEKYRQSEDKNDHNSAIYFVSCDYAEVRNMNINGISKDCIDIMWNTTSLIPCGNVVIDGCNFSNIWRDAVVVGECDNFTISNCVESGANKTSYSFAIDFEPQSTFAGMNTVKLINNNFEDRISNSAPISNFIVNGGVYKYINVNNKVQNSNNIIENCEIGILYIKANICVNKCDLAVVVFLNDTYTAKFYNTNIKYNKTKNRKPRIATAGQSHDVDIVFSNCDISSYDDVTTAGDRLFYIDKVKSIEFRNCIFNIVNNDCINLIGDNVSLYNNTILFNPNDNAVWNNGQLTLTADTVNLQGNIFEAQIVGSGATYLQVSCLNAKIMGNIFDAKGGFDGAYILTKNSELETTGIFYNNIYPNHTKAYQKCTLTNIKESGNVFSV